MYNKFSMIRIVKTSSYRDARECLAGGRPSPLRPRCCNFRSTTDAQIVRPYTATSCFDATDAQIVRPYKSLLVSF